MRNEEKRGIGEEKRGCREEKSEKTEYSRLEKRRNGEEKKSSG